jgi:PsbP
MRSAFVPGMLPVVKQSQPRPWLAICTAESPAVVLPRRGVLRALIALYVARSTGVADRGIAADELPLEQFTDDDGAFALLRPSNWARDRVVSTKQFARSSGVGAGPGVAFSLLLDPTENLSVLARPAPAGVTLSALGGPADFAKGLMASITSAPGPVRHATLLNTWRRVGGSNEYYAVEYLISSSQSNRHSICVAVIVKGYLYTLNIQIPVARWPLLAETMHTVAESFKVLL